MASTDCEDACIRLTGGTDKKGFGISASFGRLLCHYPFYGPAKAIDEFVTRQFGG